MLKALGLFVLLCVGIVVALVIYIGWRITKMGQSMGRGGVTGGDATANDYITTTGTTIHDVEPGHQSDPSPSTADTSSDIQAGLSIGDSIGASIGESAIEFGSGDSGSSDSGNTDSGGADSGGGGDSGGSGD